MLKMVLSQLQLLVLPITVLALLLLVVLRLLVRLLTRLEVWLEENGWTTPEHE